MVLTKPKSPQEIAGMSLSGLIIALTGHLYDATRADRRLRACAPELFGPEYSWVLPKKGVRGSLARVEELQQILADVLQRAAAMDLADSERQALKEWKESAEASLRSFDFAQHQGDKRLDDPLGPIDEAPCRRSRPKARVPSLRRFTRHSSAA